MKKSPPLGFADHDHAGCVTDALAQAEAVCREKGLQFTKSRRRVLEILLSEHKAMGAYDILAKLGEEGVAAQPPVAYRALDFLVSHGFAHKVEKLSAYIACSLPGADHEPAFLICRTCNTVAEQAQAAPLAGTSGFQIESAVVEAEGICPECQKS
jgi:Fur family zinc uptake transcriptional regulator